MKVFSESNDQDLIELQELLDELPDIVIDIHPACRGCKNGTKVLANGKIGCVDDVEPCAWVAYT